MNSLLEYLVISLLLSGVALICVAGIGLLKLPDLFTRAHAVAKAVTLGICLMLIALWLQSGSNADGLKLSLAITFQFFTIPIAGHLLCLLGFRKKVPRWKEKPLDDPRHK